MAALITLLSILFTLDVMNVVLHSTGISLLLSLYSRNKNKIQFVYIINLSLCELIINLVGAIETILRIINTTQYGPEKAATSPLSTACYLMYITNATGFSFVFYMNMIYITVDRLLDILLNLRYPVYWDEYKAITLLKVTWFMGIVIVAITFVCCYGYDQWVWESVMFEFLYPFLEIAFMVLAVFTYIFIFRKFKQSQLPPVHLQYDKSVSTTKKTKRQNSTFEAFKNSRFYISVLLILTFILFMIVPDLAYLFICILPKRESELILTICWIVYGIANICDAFIYIYLQAEVKELLVKKVRRLFENENRKQRIVKATYSYGTVEVKSDCLLVSDRNSDAATCL